MDFSKLRLIFICSSLAPGHDGVGDYTRRLAAALIKQGHTCAMLSINDQHIAGNTKEIQQADGVYIPSLRLASVNQLAQGLPLAKKWIEAFDPQWISLQFVPFGYHAKGLKIGLGKLLSSLSTRARWHIMFHELWVGIAVEESIKLKVWGRAQRFLLKSLVKKLSPGLVHTQTRLYQALLSGMGIEAGYLPLFSNIPAGQYTKRGLPLNKILLVVFGAIHDRAPIADFAAEAAAYAKKYGITISLTIIGRGNNEQQRWAAAFTNEGLTVQQMGEQPADVISEVLANATFGLSATALAVIEKSGSYAAMREHGLPVWSVAKTWTPRGAPMPATPAGVIAYKQGNFASNIGNINHAPYANNVANVAAIFANALISAQTT